jgi:hypothetical protein
MKQTISLTFAESVENHKGMEIIGNISENGFQIDELELLAKKYNGEIHYLNHLPVENIPEQDEAAILVFRDGLKKIFDIDQNDMIKEQDKLSKDKKCYMYGRVVDKKARHNLCFADIDQEPEYEKGKGTIVNFNRVDLMNSLRKQMYEKFGESFKELYAEGNYYYDIKKTYIGFHGDTERKKVICVRLGESFPIHYQWYYKFDKVGELMTFDINGGDIYIMSEKAVGHDWKKRNICTLRHAAGDIEVIKRTMKK